MTYTASVDQAIKEIEEDFDDATVTTEPDGSGGAFVLVDRVHLGDHYEPSTSWVRFHISFQYPEADVYPHFVSPDVRRRTGQPQDGTPLGTGTALVAFQHGSSSGQAIQLSRRSNRLNPVTDTAALKLHKVLAWAATL